MKCPKLTRRDMLRGAGVIAASAAIGMPSVSAARKPNIIYIMADDLGYGDLGCYGQAKVRTPRLDQMAEEGLRFTQCYSGSTVCAPTRCTLMTGLHTGHCRVRGNKRVPLESSDYTIAEMLSEAGYATGLVGKWGLGDEDSTGIPTKQGFDYFFGYLDQRHAHNYYPEFLYRNEERIAIEGNKEGAEFAAVEKAQWSPDLFQKEALEFIETHRDEPFFLYYATIIPHAANESGRYHGNETGEGMHLPDDAPYSNEDWPQPQKNHAAMITRLDAQVGELLDTLQSLGLAEDTLVIFTSDNGTHKEGGTIPAFFESSGPLRGIKRDLYEGGIRVPGIAWQPGTVPAGATSDHSWASWDVMATAAEIAGVDAPANTDGVSFLPAIRGDKANQAASSQLYWEFHEGGYKRALREGPWKAVWLDPDKPIELYNLYADLGEEKDLAEEHPERVASMRATMEGARTMSKEWPGKGRRK